MPNPSPVSSALNLPFPEQRAFWERKEIRGSRHWQDIRHAEHDRYFVVAGAMKADLLADLKSALDALEGGTLEHFRKDFRQIVKKHGWTGWTGEGTKAGEAWRTKVIWETNVRTSYAAGRYAQLSSPESLRALPYWRYTHSPLVAVPRQDHLALDGLTLPHDHPFWEKGFPPNDWGCRCSVRGVEKPEEGDRTEPPEGWEGMIGEGWDYAPGASVADQIREIVAGKAEKLPAELGAAFFEEIAQVASKPIGAEVARFVDATTASMREKGESVLAHVVSSAVVSKMAELKHQMETSGVWLTDSALLHGIRDAKASRGATLPISTWKNLPEHMDGAAVYLDTLETALLFVFQTEATVGEKVEKVVVAVNYAEKTRPAGSTGKREKLRGNYIRTGGIVNAYNIENESRYVRLDR